MSPADGAAEIYLDHNATTPTLPQVRDAMLAAMGEGLANASSLHSSGRRARALLEGARETVARRLGASPADIVFTSGGTEANQLAILGALAAARSRRPAQSALHAVVSGIEHPSTLDLYRHLEARGELGVTRVDADPGGQVDVGRLVQAVGESTALVSLLHANNETGVVQDVGALARACRERGIRLHCDSVQSLGKLPLDLGRLGPDLITISAHKAHGPRGVGALWIRPDCPFVHPWGGGPQERRRRPGTENLPACVGFACALDHLELPDPTLRDRLLDRLKARLPDLEVNGDMQHLVPNTLNLSFPGVASEILLIRLDMAGVQASAGSACASGAREPSHVLRSMGLGDARIASAIRLSLGRGTTADDVDRAASIIVDSVLSLRP